MNDLPNNASQCNPKRQRQAPHLHDAGPRPVLEALIAVAAGADLDDVLADFARLPVRRLSRCSAPMSFRSIGVLN